MPRADVAAAIGDWSGGSAALLDDAYTPCGDGTCEWFEHWEPVAATGSCYGDCHCGDGMCDTTGELGAPFGVAAETPANCFVDCSCGDGVCDSDGSLGALLSPPAPAETLASCYEDCHCGDGYCEPGVLVAGLLRYSENNATCIADCHCGDGVCDAGWGETPSTCQADCWCGDGVCSRTESWLTCEEDCAASCGNGVCECTSTGEWGGALCCFAGYEDAPWRDAASPGDGNVCEGMSGIDVLASTDLPGPETQDSCPFDCGVPCPPFCEAEVCADGGRLFPSEQAEHEVEYRRHTTTDAWGTTHVVAGAAWARQVVTGTGTTLKVSELLPESTYDVRVRATNGAGDGPWSPNIILSTGGLPAGGECLHDDAPCGDAGDIQQATWHSTA